LFFGALTAIASCISGYLLKRDGGYDEVLLGRHQWAGIATAIVSALAWRLNSGGIPSINTARTRQVAMILLTAGLFITGHLGGSLTHGEGYLTEGLDAYDEANDTIPVIANLQEARLYTDLVHPIVQARCVSCHGPGKQKGGLRLDDLEAIRKGGKDGPVIVDKSPEKSEFIKRLLLPMDDEHRMPAKGRTQLTKAQTALFRWWVSLGIDTDKKIKDIPKVDSVNRFLAALQEKGSEGHAGLVIAGMPTRSVTAADPKVLDSLRAAGILVIPVATGSPYLKANLVNAHIPADEAVARLALVKEQLVDLKASYSGLTDKGCATLSGLKNLVWLRLDGNNISDTGLRSIAALDSLRTLSVTGTRASKDGVNALAKMTRLSELFLFNTAVKKEDFADLQKAFPHTRLDSGGYKQEMLASDTELVKKKKEGTALK
jgi:mono/diheme cytochrome c family protein